MKRILVLLASVLASLLVLVLAVCLLRMILLKTHQVQRVEPVTDLRIDARAAAERLGGALRFPTISHENGGNMDAAAVAGLHRYLEERFPKGHAALTLGTRGGQRLPSTWKRKQPNLPPSLLLSHQDVLPVEPGTEASWTHPAFSGFLDGEWVW